MSNEIQKASGVQPTVVQNAKRSLYIENREGGIVNLNYNVPQASVTGEVLMAIQSFSRDYYQLIVTGHDIFSNNTIVVTTDRALIEGCVPAELLRTHSVLTDEAIERMLILPAIICNKNTQYHGSTDSNQKAIYAYVKKIKKCSKEIKIYFQPISFFSQHTLNEYAIDFGINTDCALTDLNKSRWYIKKVNLFEAFRDAHIEVLGPLL